MRLKSFITVSFLLLAMRAVACGPGPLVMPDDCDIYRLMPYYAELKGPDYGRRDANCQAWLKTVGGKVPVVAIRSAIYDLNLRDWLRVQQGDDRGNAFCRHLLVVGDSDAIRLLVWSKYYEQWSEEMRSPWYYGCGMDDCSFDIDSVISASTHYLETKKQKYVDRYLLLAMKCLYRSGRSEECVALWNKHKKVVRDSHLGEQAEGYLAACLNRIGRKLEAIDIYSRLGDAASLFLLVDDRVEVFERVLRNKPNSPFFPIALQRVLFVVENYVTSNEMTRFALDSLQLRRLAAIAVRAGSDNRIADKAMWRYAAACLYDHLGEPRRALPLVEKLSSGDDFLNTSIHVLRMRLHAETDPIDDAFERRLMSELRWLDARMQHEWAAADSATRFRLSHTDGFGYNFEVFRTIYANDALRRIVLARDGLYDSFRRAGRTTRALQLANMADNRFLQVSANPIVAVFRMGADGQKLYHASVDSVPTYNYDWFPIMLTDSVDNGCYGQEERFNAHDYSNVLFICADRLGADALSAYFQRVEKPVDDMDRWLNERSYTDADYWCDIVGTHMLREMRFDEAYDWLRRVDEKYVDRLNTSVWMLYDPMEYDEVALAPADRAGYKLRFAMVMGHQEAYMTEKPDPNDRADAMLQLSIGLRNAFSYRAWPLVSYGGGYFQIWDDDLLHYDNPLHNYYMPYLMSDAAATPYVEPAEHRAAELRKKAFATYTDPERKARALRRVYEYTYLMQHYADTPTGQDIARRCDRWKDYRR